LGLTTHGGPPCWLIDVYAPLRLSQCTRVPCPLYHTSKAFYTSRPLVVGVTNRHQPSQLVTNVTRLGPNSAPPAFRTLWDGKGKQIDLTERSRFCESVPDHWGSLCSFSSAASLLRLLRQSFLVLFISQCYCRCGGGELGTSSFQVEVNLYHLLVQHAVN
jgi:hypothetical protein